MILKDNNSLNASSLILNDNNIENLVFNKDKQFSFKSIESQR